MKLFVTGGAGFIGSHFVRCVLEGRYPALAGAHVTVVDKLTYAGNLANIPMEHPRLSFVHGDICDGRLMSAVVPGHDAVVHFAAESHVDRSLMNAQQFVMTNVVGTSTLLEACRLAKVQRIVHVSTDEVYGSISEGSWTEDCPLRPNSPYSSSKASSDLIARAYWRTHGLPLSITRCSNNYGPYQFAEKLIPLFVTNLLDGRDVPLYGDGHNVREWLHVDDHCRAIYLVLADGRVGGVYNIGGGVELSNRELTKRMLELCDADWSRVRHVPDRKAHDERYSVDTTRIREELAFVPQIPFERGLADVVAWYRDHRAWWEPLRIRSELTGSR
ncbi:dTDP-glucose 4,6-dehydratase [Streptomyces sulfonofaciens]|uniref:dTDP-glucose 4,6-dehydratase n=1 Tax=Streptomyces sulfonofaciens TaxID=68272 RepID=A0A919G7Z4_9ACTN|nr:dTDP-glucose 4,6-dehydratase [Streptomyces sulfonofaciens]GHH78975.1 dTDP-glucose 4,6-dehydratase [Streptomyces sulfonofaciens]